MNKAVKISFIIILLLAIIAFAIVMAVVLTKNKNKRTLNYYEHLRIYSIVENKKNFDLFIKYIVFCIRTPCNPSIEKTIKINDKEDYDLLKSLFDEKFKDNNEKEKRIDDENLTEDQIEIFLDILEKYTNYSRLEYEIIKDGDEQKIYYNSTFSKRGYYQTMNREENIYTISLGEKPNNGYTIDVSNLDIYGNSAKIFIEEGTPEEGKIYPDIIAYPIIQVKFNKDPINVTVINEKTGDIFPFIRRF